MTGKSANSPLLEGNYTEWSQATIYMCDLRSLMLGDWLTHTSEMHPSNEGDGPARPLRPQGRSELGGWLTPEKRKK